MKLSEFKQALEDRITLLNAIIVFTFQKETAYWANNWASLFSTTFYTIAMLLFINVLYANVKTVGGFNRNDMLFFFLIGQITYYTNWIVSQQNMQDFILDVNQGNLDLILTKPMPALFYITFKQVRIFSMIRDGLPPTLIIALSVNWHQITITPLQLLYGVMVFILGQICLHTLQFISVIPVIWLGETKGFLKLVNSVDQYAGRTIPVTGFNSFFRMVFSVFVPVLISTNYTTAILLNKLNPSLLLLFAISATIFSLIMRQVIWQIALKSYTSASS